MNESNLPELKPCPFCGEKAELFRIPKNDEEEMKLHPKWKWNFPGCWIVGCTKHDMCIGNLSHSHALSLTAESAAEAWNQRVQTIDQKSDMFGGILCFAVRYALGRQSTAPYTVTEFIRPILPYLSDNAVRNLKKDVSECFDYGAECDVRTWTKFLSGLDSELSRREFL